MVVVAEGSAALIDYFAHSPHQQDIVRDIQDAARPDRRLPSLPSLPSCSRLLRKRRSSASSSSTSACATGDFGEARCLAVCSSESSHGDSYAALPLALGGVVLCAVYYCTRNAFAPMISHALFNALSIVALLVAPQAHAITRPRRLDDAPRRRSRACRGIACGAAARPASSSSRDDGRSPRSRT